MTCYSYHIEGEASVKSSRCRETHSESFWARHLEDWRGSGLSQQAYCQRHGLALSTLQLWRRRLASGAETRGGGTAPKFEIVPLRLPIVEEKTLACPVVLVMAGGRYRVEVTEGATPVALRILLDTLEARA